MNTRDRLAWDKHLASTLPPHPTGESSVITMPGKVPSKANSYEVRFHPGFWKQIDLLVKQWRKTTKQSPYWIGPSDAVKDYEEALAYWIKTAEPFRFDGPLALTVTLHGQVVDIDNALKVALDSIQQSGIIKDDNQFTLLTVEKVPAATPGLGLQLHRRP